MHHPCTWSVSLNPTTLILKNLAMGKCPSYFDDFPTKTPSKSICVTVVISIYPHLSPCFYGYLMIFDTFLPIFTHFYQFLHIFPPHNPDISIAAGISLTFRCAMVFISWKDWIHLDGMEHDGTAWISEKITGIFCDPMMV